MQNELSELPGPILGELLPRPQSLAFRSDTIRTWQSMFRNRINRSFGGSAVIP